MASLKTINNILKFTLTEAYPKLANNTTSIIVEIAELPELKTARVIRNGDKYIIQFNKKHAKKMSKAEIIVTLLHELAHIAVGLNPTNSDRTLSKLIYMMLDEAVACMITILKVHKILDKTPKSLQREIIEVLINEFGPENPVHAIFECGKTLSKILRNICERKNNRQAEPLVQLIMKDKNLEQKPLTTIILLMYALRILGDVNIDVFVC